MRTSPVVPDRPSVEWAVSGGVLTLPRIDPYDVLAKGRRYRVNHAVRITKSGVQYTFWATMGFAPHDHMERAFAQRREQIISDCVQLRTDVDAYNDMSKESPIQLVLDFTEDVAERQVIVRPRRAA
jgi:hypothetical protein